MPAFIAVYAGGDSVSSARLVALTADPAIVAQVTDQILREHASKEPSDPIVEKLERGRKAALRLIRKEGRQHDPA